MSTDQNKQLNNCTCGNPPRGAHWESCASLCTKSNYEGRESLIKSAEKAGEVIRDFEKRNYEGEEKCGICKHNTPCHHSRLDNIMFSLPSQDNDWKEGIRKIKGWEYVSESLIEYIKSLLALREQEAYEKVNDKWLSLNLRNDNKENWSSELDKFGVFMQLLAKMSLSPEEEK